MTRHTPTEAEFSTMRDRLMARTEVWDRRQKKRRSVGIVGAAGLVAVVGMGAAWVALANPQVRETAIYCYESASINAEYATVVDADAARSGEVAKQSAIDMCAAAWKAGAVGRETEQDQIGTTPVLKACTRLDGVTAVFPADPEDPGTDFCRRIGLAP